MNRIDKISYDELSAIRAGIIEAYSLISKMEFKPPGSKDNLAYKKLKDAIEEITTHEISESSLFELFYDDTKSAFRRIRLDAFYKFISSQVKPRKREINQDEIIAIEKYFNERYKLLIKLPESELNRVYLTLLDIEKLQNFKLLSYKLGDIKWDRILERFKANSKIISGIRLTADAIYFLPYPNCEQKSFLL